MLGDLRKPVGGIRAVMLTPVTNVTIVRDGVYTVVDDGLILPLDILEDRSSYVAQCKTPEGVAMVSHKLTIVLEEPAGRELVERFAPPVGVVAIVSFNSGVTIIVGWSEHFEGEQPLRLTQVEYDSGHRAQDLPVAELCFESCDTSFAEEVMIQIL